MTPTHFILASGFLMSLSGLAFNRTHLLSALLCLEGMMLSLYLSLSLWALQLESTDFSAAPMILLAFAACGASAGLALLVATTRTHGSDHIRSLNLLQC
nr:NADH dehydrogenase subunit 4L [Idiacanthus fasciola]